VAAALAAGLCACQALPSTERPPAPSAPAPQAEPAARARGAIPIEPGQEVPLFDGQTLGMWEEQDFGAEGGVEVKDGAIHLGWGSPGTGIAWTGGAVPPNYELSLDVMRLQGSGASYLLLTFPVGGLRCSLAFDTWSGAVCESPHSDAEAPSRHGDLKRFTLDPEKWYSVRLRVASERIHVSVDGEELAEVDTTNPASGGSEATNPAASAGSEAAPSQTLEIAAWATGAAFRDIRLRRLPETAR
jgi:hypothetical protein